MLNDELERHEIVRQLRELHSAGWGAVITRTFVGLRTAYLSEEWMTLTKEIIKQSKEVGMKVWLQAGYMPSAVPGLEDKFKHKVIGRGKRGERRNGNEELLCETEDHVYYLRRLENVIDLLSPEATDFYIKVAYEVPWFNRFGGEFGKSVEAVWVDEPQFEPPLLPWSDGLPTLFEREWRYSLTRSIPSLFTEVGDFQKVRHHYWRTVTRMFATAYTERVGNWCAGHGVKFSGHLMGEDTLNSQIAWTAAAMPHYEYMQLPGIDHLTLSLDWPLGTAKFLMTPKQCSSVADQLGKGDILAEMYGVSSQGITFEDRKYIGDWLAVLGINYRCLHGSFYSMRGRRKRTYVPHLSYQQPWWGENRMIADYFARLSYALRQGKYLADVLVLHPVESAYCIYDPTKTEDFYDRTEEPHDIRALNDCVVSLSENLMKAHRGFEYGDESLMAKYGAISGRCLTVGEMAYKAVILPSLITLRRTTVDLLMEFIESGGTVLSVGELPSRIDGEISVAELDKCVKRVENEKSALKGALDKIVPAEISISADGTNADEIWVHGRSLKEGERLYFLFNTSRTRAFDAAVKIHSYGRLENWCLQTGEVKPIRGFRERGFMITRLSFAPATSHLILLKEGKRGAGEPEDKHEVSHTYRLPDAKRIRRHSPNAVTLDFCRLRKGVGDWSDVLPVIGVQEMLDRERYEGPIALEFTFNVERDPRSILAVIEDAAGYEVSVNGVNVKYSGLPHYVDKSFHPIDITDCIRLGQNVITISRHFRPVPKPQFSLSGLFESLPGVELEAIYLIGEFAVKGAPKERNPKCARYRPEFVLTDERVVSKGDLIADGYPFFAGRIGLSAEIELKTVKKGTRHKFTIEIPHLNAVVANVRINGRKSGAIAWPPYELEITRFVRKGVNTIEIELTNSLRNLLGPHHRTSGEPSSTWNTDFSGAWSEGERTSYPNWFRERDKVPNWTDDYFFVPFGLEGEIRIKCYTK